jgi:prevent-host-death family protein
MCAMIVTATEFKTNIGKYLKMDNEEDILITRNGRNVAKLINAQDNSIASLQTLRGIIKGTDLSLKDVREQRQEKYHEGSDRH